jgi:hypothetical protein
MDHAYLNIEAPYCHSKASIRLMPMGKFRQMTRFLIRLLLIASAFYFVFPEIPGVTFHGTFVHAAVAGLVFVVVAWVVELVAIAISAMLAVGTLGLALVILIPAWLLGFWILPAVGLKYLAMMMPETLSFTGWTPVLYASLPMLVIGVITSGDVHEKARKSRDDAKKK